MINGYQSRFFRVGSFCSSFEKERWTIANTTMIRLFKMFLFNFSFAKYFSFFRTQVRHPERPFFFSCSIWVPFWVRISIFSCYVRVYRCGDFFVICLSYVSSYFVCGIQYLPSFRKKGSNVQCTETRHMEPNSSISDFVSIECVSFVILRKSFEIIMHRPQRLFEC